MNWADLAILGVIFISASISLVRGFVREAMSLLAWALAGWLAFNYSAQIGEYLAQWIPARSARMGAGFGLIFVGVLMLSGFVIRLVKGLIKQVGLTATDRSFGMIFGVLRGLVIITVLVTAAGFTPMPQDQWWHKSSLIRQFQPASQWIKARLPDSVGQYLSY